MLRSKVFIIFAILMVLGGVGYNVYYFKVGKQKKILKALGRAQSRNSGSNSASNSASNPATSPGFSSPVTTTSAAPETGTASQPPALSASASERIALPLSDRLLGLAQRPSPSNSTSGSEGVELEAGQGGKLDLDQSLFAAAPRSNRNPFFTVEEEQMLRMNRLNRPRQASKPSQSKSNEANEANEAKQKAEAPPLLQDSPDLPTDLTSTAEAQAKPQFQPVIISPSRSSPPTVAEGSNLPNLKLSAIIINGVRKVAIIEGQRFSEGGLIGLEKVVEIKADYVVLQSGKNRRELRLALAKNRATPLIVKKEAR